MRSTLAAETHPQLVSNSSRDMVQGNMWSGANFPSVVGEIITAITNASAGTFESAPVSTLMGTFMIQRMLELVGFINGEGQMTSGSRNANLIAMMAARNRANQFIRQKGLFEQGPLYAFVSEDAHY
jgi:glutamate/tyrosine decarboxylase-like PLP-dependent enzyme